MKNALIFLLAIFCFSIVSAQTVAVKKRAPVKPDLNKLVETEKSFARTADEKGTIWTDSRQLSSPPERSGELHRRRAGGRGGIHGQKRRPAPTEIHKIREARSAVPGHV